MTIVRDFSKLADLLAGQTASPAKKTTKSVGVNRHVPANDNKPARDQLAWPAFERLAYRGDHARLFALRHWKNMLFPGSEISVPEHEDYDPEVTVEIRPSEAELLTAVGWEVVDRKRWDYTGEMVNMYAPKSSTETRTKNRNGGTDTQIGVLMFRDGKLIQWGKTGKGSPLKPVERPRGKKGGSSASRTEGAILAYLGLKGAVSPLAATPYAKPFSAERAIGDCYDPLPKEAPNARDKRGRYGVAEARELLREHGVDGSVPFEQLPVPATRCDDGLVAGDQWIGGVKQPKPTASEPAGKEPEFVRQVETISYVDYLRRRLGDHARVLDMAVTDASAKEIGVAMGHAPAYAEKRGPALIDAAIDELMRLDETARGTFQPMEEKIAA